MMSTMTAFKNRMCACIDAACAPVVHDDLTWRSVEKADLAVPKSSAEETADFAQLDVAMGICARSSEQRNFVEFE